MSEVKSALQRLGDLAHIPNDALERLSRKRARTQRNRRIGAALLAFMVAGAGISLGLAAFIGSSHPRPSRPAVPRSAIAIWPQQTLRQVSVAQRLAEAGDPDKLAFTPPPQP